MVFFGNRAERRQKARADGYYTHGKGKFKLKKGSFLPREYDEIFYDEDTEPERRVTTDDFRNRKIAKSSKSSEGEDSGEEVDEDTSEQKKRSTKAGK